MFNFQHTPFFRIVLKLLSAKKEHEDTSDFRSLQFLWFYLQQLHQFFLISSMQSIQLRRVISRQPSGRRTRFKKPYCAHGERDALLDSRRDRWSCARVNEVSLKFPILIATLRCPTDTSWTSWPTTT